MSVTVSSQTHPVFAHRDTWRCSADGQELTVWDDEDVEQANAWVRAFWRVHEGH